MTNGTPTGFPVAITGIGCRFPGAHGPAALWELLCAGGDATSDIPRHRFDVDRYYDPRPGTPGKLVTRRGGFLDGIDLFDAGFFGIAPREAGEMDPQQRLLLETAWEAIEDAGLTPARLGEVRTGVYVGGMASAYWEMMSRAGVVDIYAGSGGMRSMMAGRLSYAFDLRGPSVCVDAACSSSLVALHLAYQSLKAGECALALAGGVNLVLAVEESMPYSSARMLSPDGRCKFGSAQGDGFARSEGVAVVVLKPLAAALSDGDDVHAVIYGTATGNDGQAGGYLLTPAQAGQEEMLLAAYRDAGVSPSDVDYVEAHGTGTPAGDPVELSALAAVLGPGRPEDRRCLVGSVKTNIGHTEAAAGLAGLIKTVLCLKHRRIPPSLHAAELTPAVDWATLPLVLVREDTPWPDTGSRAGLAGVSSFGISGTNAHVVVGEFAVSPVPSTVDGPGLLVLSAPTPEALPAVASSYASFLADPAVPAVRDVCYSAAVHRKHHESRLTVVGETAEELADGLRAFAAGETRPRMSSVDEAGTADRLVFVYPGQGSQWAGMGRDLMARSPVFRDVIEECSSVIRAEAGWSLTSALDGTLVGIDVIQPALWAMGLALTAVWRSWGIEPDAVVGHSMGEVAAACASGALSLADGGAVICRRSRLLRSIAGRGAMLTVELSAAEAALAVADYSDGVSVAVSNGPGSTVLSGDPVALEAIAKSLTDRGIFCRPVNVDVASHSPQVDPLRAELLSLLGDIAPQAGRVPLYSTVDVAALTGAELDAAYWVRNLREPVRFGATVDLLGSGSTVFVEVSPHPVLLPALRDLSSSSVGCLRRDEPELAGMLDAVGALHRAGYPVPWSTVYGSPPPRYVRLPSYPWQRQRYWFDRGHPLLGSTVDGDGLEWRCSLDVRAEPYLLDHRVQDTVVLPGTAYLELAIAAGRELVGSLPVSLSDVDCRSALFLDPSGAPPAVSIRLAAAGEGWTFDVVSPEGTHVTGGVRPGAAPAAPLALDTAFGDREMGSDFYARWAAIGNEWAPAFQGIAELWRGDGVALARIQAPAGLDLTGYHCHPAVLDACAQVVAALIPDSEAGVFVLGGIDEVRVHRTDLVPAWSHVARAPSWRSDSCMGDVRVAASDGTVLVELIGVRLQFLGRPSRDPRPWLHELRWVPRGPAPAPVAPARSWLILADRGGTGEELARLLGGVVATAGPAYRPVGPGRYEIDPSSVDDYRRLLADVGDVSGVVHLWALDEADPDHGECSSVLHLVQALSDVDLPGRLWLVTRAAQRVGDTAVSIRQAPVWGFGRVVAHEHPRLRCSLVDVDATVDVAALARELSTDDGEDQIALRGGERYVARLAPLSRADGAFALGTTSPGILDGLRFEPMARRAPGPGEVEVRADVLTLNYRDALIAMGRLPDTDGTPTHFGGECAGTVTAVGERVAGLRPGDEVVALALPVPTATHMCVSAHLVSPLPRGLTAAEGATLPVAFVTAYHGLCELARLTAGERVLIHHATGGVGLAALQIARWKGAEVYATAGSPEKRALLSMMGVKHVADSRSLDFADEILAATRGEGVHVVLNTLAGEGLMRSLSLLAPYGRHVELSERDLIEGASMDMRLLRRNISFFAVDVVDMAIRHPRRVGAILRDVCRLVDAGVFTPLPFHEYPADDLTIPFRQMVQARHVGKVLVSAPAPVSDEAARPVRIDPDAGYLVTGGLGDLGRVMADWLVREGARHLVLIGRSPEPAADPWLDSLRSHGVDVVYESVDVADVDALRAAVERCSWPVRGVIHAAGVIEYVAVSELSAAALAAVLRPKVAGAWALHRLFESVPLDFFVLFSSGSALLSSPLLGSYAAANAALDALAVHRRSAGLPALSVNWGFWSVGMPVRQARAEGRRINPVGMETFTPDEGVAALRLLLAEDATNAAVLPADWAAWSAAYPDAARVPLLREVVAGPNGGAAPSGSRSGATSPVRAAVPAQPDRAAARAQPAQIGRAAAPRRSGAASGGAAAPGPIGVPLAAGVPAGLGGPFAASQGVAAPGGVAAPAPGGQPPASAPAVPDGPFAASPASGGPSAPGGPLMTPSASAAPGVVAAPGGPFAASPAPTGPFPASPAPLAAAVPGNGPARPAPPAGPTAVPGNGPARPAPPDGLRGTAAPAGFGTAAAAEEYLRKTAATVLGLPVSSVHTRRPLKRQGLDSLMAVELRTRVQRDLGLLLPITKMLGGQTIAEIAEEIVTKAAQPQ